MFKQIAQKLLIHNTIFKTYSSFLPPNSLMFFSVAATIILGVSILLNFTKFLRFISHRWLRGPLQPLIPISLGLSVASPQTSFGVRFSRIHFSRTESVGEKWMRDKRTPKDVCGEASLSAYWAFSSPEPLGLTWDQETTGSGDENAYWVSIIRMR